MKKTLKIVWDLEGNAQDICFVEEQIMAIARYDCVVGFGVEATSD